MTKVIEKNLRKELEFYSNLLAQHEKNKRSSNPVISNKESLSCSASGNVSSLPKNEFNVVHNQVLKTNFSRVKQDKYFLIKNKSFVKSSKKGLSPKSSFSNVSETDFINKAGKMSSITKTDNEAKSSLKCKESDPIATSIKSNDKLDSKKLMGEIMALTNQLKLKSGTFHYLEKVKNHNLNKQNSLKIAKVSSSSAKNISLKTYDVSVSNIKHFDKNPHVYKKNHNFTVAKSFSANNQSKGTIQNTKFVAKSPNKNMGPVNSQIKITNLSMMKKLDEVKKALGSSTKKELKRKSNHIDLKKNSVDVIVKKEISNRKDTSTEKDPLLGPIKSNKFSLFIQNKKSCTFSQKSPYVLAKPNDQKRNKSCEIKNKFSYNSHNTKSLPLSVKNLNSKYKVINKKETPKSSSKKLPEKNISKSINYSSAKKSMYRLVNNKICISSPKLKSHLSHKSIKNYSNSRSLLNSVSRESTYLMKKLPCNKILVRASPNTFRLRSKYHLSKVNSSSSMGIAKLSELSNSLSNETLNDGVDVDLLLELAAEKKERIAMRRLYKSKNRIIDHSVQAKTVRMIKSKYFKTNKRPLWKNGPTSLMSEGFSRNYLHKNRKFGNNSKMKFQSKKHFLNSQKKKLCFEQKKIVSLEGEKFIVGSTGKSLKKIKPNAKTKKASGFKKTPLKKYTFIKNNSPASKAIASRVLNRSINRVLSASAKKKMEKVNTYCMFYNRFGRCNKGIDCSYVHDPSKIAVCTRFLRGTCKNDKCLFSHETDPGKMAICTFFLQDACTKDDCPYRHEKLSPKAELCKAFVQGYCADGKECQKAHVLICLKYIQGICDKGKDCVFPHPDNTRKTSDSKSTNATKEKDNIFENVLRYYEVLPNESSAKGLVVSRVKNLPEQPSFISLTMDESL